MAHVLDIGKLARLSPSCISRFCLLFHENNWREALTELLSYVCG